MPSLIDLRRRIRSVKNTQQITKAMKMVSAAKLRRAQQQAVAARPYADLLREMLSGALGHASAGGDFEHPFLTDRPEQRVAVLLFSGEKGLCGAFNAQVIREATRFVAARKDKEIGFEFIGRKGRDFFRRREVVETGSWTNVLVSVEFDKAREIAQQAADLFASARYDAVYVLYTQFKSALTQEPVLRKLLPIESPEGDSSPAECIFEQSPAEMFERLLPRYVEVQIYQAMLESSASEHASRMTAMDAATRNAGDVINQLTLHLNRVRQASITTEIIEVVSGAAALE